MMSMSLLVLIAIMSEAFLTSERSAEKMDLVIKTTDTHFNNRPQIYINGNTFERVDHFRHLGSINSGIK